MREDLNKFKELELDSEEISVNGLVGSLIFGRTIGEKISYEFNGVSCSVEIMAKLNHVKKDNKNI